MNRLITSCDVRDGIERFAHAAPAEAPQQIGRKPFVQLAIGHQSGAAIERVAGIRCVRIAVGELARNRTGNVERHGQRMVEHIHPDHRLFAFVAMVVPMMWRRQNYVADFSRRASFAPSELRRRNGIQPPELALRRNFLQNSFPRLDGQETGHNRRDEGNDAQAQKHAG